MESAKKLRLVILDACRDNPFTKSMKKTLSSRAISRGLVGIEPTKPNTLIAFAAKAGSTASDGDGAHSPFTTALLRHLTTPGLDLRKAFGRVRDEVLTATNDSQEPFVYGSLGGADVSLVPNSFDGKAGVDQTSEHGEIMSLPSGLGLRRHGIHLLRTTATLTTSVWLARSATSYRSSSAKGRCRTQQTPDATVHTEPVERDKKSNATGDKNKT